MKEWTVPVVDFPPSFIENIPTFIILKAGDYFLLPDINSTNDKSVNVSIELGSGRFCMSADQFSINTSVSCESKNYSVVVTLTDFQQLKSTYLVTI